MSSRLIDDVERRITEWKPERRRRFAVHVLVWSVVGTVIAIVFYVIGLATLEQLLLVNVMSFVTLVLSMLALTLTSADLVATTDVREVEERR